MKTSFQWTFDKQNYSRFFHFKLTWLSWPFSSPPILPRHWCQGSSSLVIKCHVRPCQFFQPIEDYFVEEAEPCIDISPTTNFISWKGEIQSCAQSSEVLFLQQDVFWSLQFILGPLLSREHRNIVKLWTIFHWQVVLGLSNSFSPIGTRTLGASTLHESLGNKR